MKLSQDLKIGSSVFIHFFHKYLLNPHFVLDIGEQDQVSVPIELAFQWRKTDNKQIDKYIECRMFVHVLAKRKEDTGDRGY